MRKVEATIEIALSREKILQAFTDMEMLKDWWGVEKGLIEIKNGGLYTLTWNITENGFGYVSSGIIQSYSKDKELVIGNLVYLNPEKPLLGPMTLTIRTLEKEERTNLYVCQEGYQKGEDWDWYYEAVKEAWPIVLKNLKVYLEQL